MKLILVFSFALTEGFKKRKEMEFYSFSLYFPPARIWKMKIDVCTGKQIPYEMGPQKDDGISIDIRWPCPTPYQAISVLLVTDFIKKQRSLKNDGGYTVKEIRNSINCI